MNCKMSSYESVVGIFALSLVAALSGCTDLLTDEQADNQPDNLQTRQQPQEPGQTWEPEGDDYPLSPGAPHIVRPVWACTKVVFVDGLVPNATVEVVNASNDDVLGTGTATYRGHAAVSVPSLSSGQVLYAQQ